MRRASRTGSSSATQLTISVVVPSYGRPDVLRVCLESLVTQDRCADEILVVHRIDDGPTRALAQSFGEQRLRTVAVRPPGLLAALEAGARQATGTVIAMTDDDAAPRPDWIARLLGRFADPGVGGVGGRDIQPDVTGEEALVGLIGRWGRVVGNHHVGLGPPRDVDVVKGVNMAWRRAALAFPVGLRGRATQTNTEIPIALWARRMGWRIEYDPEIIVDHRPAPRAEGSRRLSADAAYNLAAGMTVAGGLLPWRRAVYGIAVGDRGAPGIVRGLAACGRGERDVLRDLAPSLQGQSLAFLDLIRDRRVRMVPLEHLGAGPAAR